MRGSILIAGPAGDGINTASNLVTRVLKKKGFFIYSSKDYMSRVRGGFNYTKSRFSSEFVESFDNEVDFLIVLDKQGQSLIPNLRKTGLIITSDKIELEDTRVITLKEKYIKDTFGKWTFPMAALGVLFYTIGIEMDFIKEMNYSKWSQEIMESNMKAISYGFDIGSASLQKRREDNLVQIKNIVDDTDRIMLSGNQAIALGAAAGGLDFYCAYPMAPSTGVMTYLNKYSKEMKIIVEQAEDEIAAINAAIGASAIGARAMTGSSGGGYALMVEGLGFSAVGEVPLVVVDVQRPGPATGLPTRTEQADLSFVLYASQGEFSRMIMAPRSIEDAFYQTFRALNIADQYNMPITILSDEFLADSVQVISKFDLRNLKIERHLATELNDYKRYDFNEVRGSRCYSGMHEDTLIMVDSHVHNEDGSITEDPDVTMKLKHKLMAKEELLKEDLLEPLYIGVEVPKVLITSWGSTYGALKEAVEILTQQGYEIGMLSFSDIYPLPQKLLKKYSERAEKIINVEQNYTNQFGKILILEGNVRYDTAINKYDGRPFSAGELVERLEVLLNEE